MSRDMGESLLSTEVCEASRTPDLDDLETVMFDPDPPLADYHQAMELANQEAKQQLGEVLLLSWYDRDRNFESPMQASASHQGREIPGYVDYGLQHGARLVIDIHMGRFVFYYLPISNN
jgi:hypothetical protein